MTPGRRLDQLEPVVADVLQKVDRLIEGQGQLIEIETRADQNANTTAKGLANLTLTTQKQFEQVNIRFDLVDARFRQVDTRFDQIDARFERIEANQNEMRQDITLLKQDVSLLKVGQELIIQILREKLP